MKRYSDAQLVPIGLALGDRLGLTVWAPSFRDPDGDEAQGFLGQGTQVMAFVTANDLARYLSDRPTDDLASHPAWPSLLRRPPDELRAGPGDLVDFDDLFRLLADDPTPAAYEAISNAVQLAEAIADACGDTELVNALARKPYQRARGGPPAVLDGRTDRAWQQLGEEVSASWEWIVDRLERHIRWVGDTTRVDLEAVQMRANVEAPWVAAQPASAPAWGHPGYGPAAPDALLPSTIPTIAVTFFFGLFGLIPAAVATGKARAAGVHTGRYWASFGWTLVTSFLIWMVCVVLAFGIVAGTGP